ncbi:MAG: OmpA family protein [Deltaproteobacteria bacterium]|nr:OmpA family protein [Deltaproteobacteria bacterium]
MTNTKTTTGINLGIGAGVCTLKRNTEPKVVDGGCFDVDLTLGISPPVLSFEDTYFSGAPILEIDYNYTLGNAGNLGSNRHQMALGGGYRINFLNYFLIEQTLGIGVNYNRLNFGDGTIPEGLPGFSFISTSALGLEFNLTDNLAISAMATFKYEKNPGPNLDYDKMGLALSTFLTYRIPTGDENQPHHETTKEAAKEDKQPVNSGDSSTSTSQSQTGIEPTLLKTKIFFESGQANLPLKTDSRNSGLDSLADQLSEEPGMAVIIHAYAEEIGDVTHRENAILALKRATTVRSYLIKKCGTDPKRVIVDGAYVMDIHKTIIDAKGKSIHASNDPVVRQNRRDDYNRYVMFEPVPFNTDEETKQ